MTMLGMHHSSSTKAKISAWHVGRPRSEATKKKLSDLRTGLKAGPHSAETKRKIALANTGKKFSEERKRNIGKTLCKKCHHKVGMHRQA